MSFSLHSPPSCVPCFFRLPLRLSETHEGATPWDSSLSRGALTSYVSSSAITPGRRSVPARCAFWTTLQALSTQLESRSFRP